MTKLLCARPALPASDFQPSYRSSLRLQEGGRMNRIRVGMLVVLFLSLAVFSYAQQPAQDSGPPTQEQPNKEREAAPPARQPEMTPPRGQEETKPPKQQPEVNPPKTERQEAPRPPNEQQKPAHEQHGTSAQQGKAHRMGKSAHIPDPQFKANF